MREEGRGGLCSCEIAVGVNDDTMDPSDPSITQYSWNWI